MAVKGLQVAVYLCRYLATLFDDSAHLWVKSSMPFSVIGIHQHLIYCYEKYLLVCE